MDGWLCVSSWFDSVANGKRIPALQCDTIQIIIIYRLCRACLQYPRHGKVTPANGRT
ncbi:AAEL011894-PA [Aedes aegypti]|uniref:AAEL011894-PA n=1 Tax=Aedes aegypti TaxID=7159 RepID=Q16NQ7_AEDAE|nr:AAEL011894-PA [Aedes aegypti]